MPRYWWHTVFAYHLGAGRSLVKELGVNVEGLHPGFCHATLPQIPQGKPDSNYEIQSNAVLKHKFKGLWRLFYIVYDTCHNNKMNAFPVQYHIKITSLPPFLAIEAMLKNIGK